MDTNEIQKLLSEPDAVLFGAGRSQELNDFVDYCTVPLTFFDGVISADTVASTGTGVLLNLDGRGFVLTAGHVVDDYVEFGLCAVGIARRPHRHIARFIRHAIRFDEKKSIDFGFFEIDPDDFAAYRSYDRGYLSPARLLVQNRTDLRAANDWMIVAGYPDAVINKSQQGHGYRLLTYSTTIAGLGPVPESPLPHAHPSMQVVDLCRPLDGQLLAFPGEMYEVEVPSFRGASGGGCWKAGVRPDPRAFSVNGMRLAAIHTGTMTEALDTSIGPCLFAREVLVGHHLRLIADSVPEVRETVFRHWPQLRDDSWMQPST